MKAAHVLGVIPARGGSRGIPRKNLAPLAGKPLIAHTLEAVRRSALLTRAVLSSEDQEIIAVAREYGADVPFVRPMQLAADSATSADVARHAVMAVEGQEERKYGAVCLLEPTSPLRTAEDIDTAITLLLESDVDAVVSVMRVEAPHPVKTLVIKGGRLRPFLPEGWQEGRPRQQLEPVYAVNGAVYCVRRDVLVDRNSLWGNAALPYVMPPERSVNIDTLLDLQFAEFLEQRSRLA